MNLSTVNTNNIFQIIKVLNLARCFPKANNIAALGMSIGLLKVGVKCVSVYNFLLRTFSLATDNADNILNKSVERLSIGILSK